MNKPAEAGWFNVHLMLLANSNDCDVIVTSMLTYVYSLPLQTKKNEPLRIIPIDKDSSTLKRAIRDMQNTDLNTFLSIRLGVIFK